jgi:hypothetical protein
MFRVKSVYLWARHFQSIATATPTFPHARRPEGTPRQLGNRRGGAVLPELPGFVGVSRGVERPSAAQPNGSLTARSRVTTIGRARWRLMSAIGRHLVARRCAGQTVEDVDVWEDLRAHVGDRQVYGMAVEIRAGRLKVQDAARRCSRMGSVTCGA